MSRTGSVSKQTRNNWLIDAAVVVGGVVAAVTGVYFLFLPVGGYQGGRNPMYGVTILFSRRTWDNLHTWSGVLMIAVVMIHVILHWGWIASMSRRVAKNLMGRPPYLNRKGILNVLIDAAIAISFFATAVSGVYLLFVPGGREGRLLDDPLILFSRTQWDLVHTWSGVVIIVAALVHLVIHWGWVAKVSANILHSLPGLRVAIAKPDVAQS